MNPIVKQQWVQALRDNRDKQTFGALREPDNSRCALGQLMLLAEKEGLVEINPYGAGFLCNNGQLENGGLPDNVVHWAGFEDSAPNLYATLNDHDHPVYRSIINLNDDLRFDFDQLAKLIDDQL